MKSRNRKSVFNHPAVWFVGGIVAAYVGTSFLRGSWQFDQLLLKKDVEV